MRALALALLLAACGAPLHETDSASCGSCHPNQLATWQGSAHARSMTSPVFAALLPRVEAAWGASARAQCVACHQPGHGGEEGAIGCASCHLAVGNRGESNGALIVKPEAPVSGPRGDATKAPHTVTTRGFFRSASLCGTCHEVKTPHLVEETLTEYRASSRASEDECTSCHLDEHRFSGLEPKWNAPADEQARGREAARVLVDKALLLEMTGREVRLTNRGAAHAVPTGQVALRDVWVDVTLTDATGARTEFARVIELGARLERAGQPVVLLTDATQVTARGLRLGETRTWSAPREGQLEARLMFRAVREDALLALGLEAELAQVPQVVVSLAR